MRPQSLQLPWINAFEPGLSTDVCRPSMFAVALARRLPFLLTRLHDRIDHADLVIKQKRKIQAPTGDRQPLGIVDFFPEKSDRQ